MKLSVAYDVEPRPEGVHAAMVRDHFGISVAQGRRVVAEELDLPLQSGDVVCFSGPSGSGKSSLLRAAAAALDGVLDIDALPLAERCLVDALELPFPEALQLLSRVGLSEASLLLRMPRELSDGERYRFRLALGLSKNPRWLLSDEFTATLDRTTAKVIAFNLRKLADVSETGCLLATTHEDLLDDLQPDLHVVCGLGEPPRCVRRDVPTGDNPGVKKKVPSASPARCGSPRGPRPTGRISRGGIIAATASASCGSSRCCGTESGRSGSACSHRRPGCCRSETASSDSRGPPTG